MLHQTIKAAIPDAMRARDAVRLQTLRSLTTAMTNEVVAKKRKPDEFLTDDEAITVLKRAANQRKDSIEGFTKGGRPELAETEYAELAIIETLLPEQMSREAIEEVVKRHLSEGGAIEPGKGGILVGKVMKELAGKADGGLVKEVVESLI